MIRPFDCLRNYLILYLCIVRGQRFFFKFLEGLAIWGSAFFCLHRNKFTFIETIRRKDSVFTRELREVA